MKKGIDKALFREVKVDNTTGKVVSERLVMRRPAHGIKVLAARAVAKRAAKKTRQKQHLIAAVERRHRKRRSARA